MTKNADIKAAAMKAGVKLWEIAEKYGLNDGNFSRKLRNELPLVEKQKIKGIIAEIKSARR